jgi:hypothetical protein
MNDFITGGLATMLIILAILFLAGVPERDTQTLNALNICEKSLPRDQKCIIVAIPAQESVPNTEQKALNEIKGETK